MPIIYPSKDAAYSPTIPSGDLAAADVQTALNELDTEKLAIADIDDAIAATTHAASDKATPVDADEIPLVDSAASWVLKKLTWTNIKATLSSVFAVLAGKTGGQTLIGGTGVTDKLVLQGTSGNGTSTATALEVLVGNNGATRALTVLNDSNILAKNVILSGPGVNSSIEKLVSAGWTVGAGWTESPDDTFTHTGGSGTAALTHSVGIINTGSSLYYTLTYTITGRTAGSITIVFGNRTVGPVSTSGVFSSTSTATTGFSVTPTTDFDGTCTFSLKEPVSFPLEINNTLAGSEAIQRWKVNNILANEWKWQIGNGSLPTGVLYLSNEDGLHALTVDTNTQVSFIKNVAAPGFASSVTGRGNSPLISWVNTGGNFNGKISLYESYPSGTVSIDQWLCNDGIWRVCRNTTTSSISYPMVILGATQDVGIGIESPTARLHVVKTTEQLRLGYDASNYASFTVDAAGNLTLATTGTTPSVYTATLRSGVKVTPVTTTASPAATDSGTAYNNIGDSDGATITLPSCAAGLQFTACVMVAQTLTVTAGSGDVIRISSNVTAAAGSITSSVIGSSVTLIGQNNETWLATSSIGSWTI